MQDNNRNTPQQQDQHNSSRSNQGTESNETQQAMNQRPLNENQSAGDLSARDQQEGNMNNGTLGSDLGEDTGE